VAGPLETIGMLLMAPYFLSQKRSKVQIVDTDISFAVFSETLARGNIEFLPSFTSLLVMMSILSFGNLETILSAVALPQDEFLQQNFLQNVLPVR